MLVLLVIQLGIVEDLLSGLGKGLAVVLLFVLPGLCDAPGTLGTDILSDLGGLLVLLAREVGDGDVEGVDLH